TPGVAASNVTRPFADDDTEFSLVVDAFGRLRMDDRVSRSDQRRRRLEENQRFAGWLVAEFPGVLGIIAGDAYDLGWRAGRQEARSGRQLRQIAVAHAQVGVRRSRPRLGVRTIANDSHGAIARAGSDGLLSLPAWSTAETRYT